MTERRKAWLTAAELAALKDARDLYDARRQTVALSDNLAAEAGPAPAELTPQAQALWDRYRERRQVRTNQQLALARAALLQAETRYWTSNERLKILRDMEPEKPGR